MIPIESSITERDPARGEALESTAVRLAYSNDEFMLSDAGRPIRILSEYLAPLRALQQANIRDTVVFFGSARMSAHSAYYQAAQQLAADVTRWGRSIAADGSRLVVCSGGGGGIMEAANRGAKEAGGRSLGLNIGLPNEQRPNAYLDSRLSFQFHYFFMRKLWFAHLATAIVIFPGGFGTLDEMFEILTLRQTRKLGRDICIILYGREYWNEVVNFEALLRHGMIDASDLELIHLVDTPAEALQWLQENISVADAGCCPNFAQSSTPCCDAHL